MQGNKLNGLGVYDYVIREHYDPETGETYEALTSCNNQEMADRCKVKNAKKVVWCIKANADFNSNASTSLRAGIRNGNVNLLDTEFNSEDTIKKISGYKSMSLNEKSSVEMPYIQTSLAINEMINLEHSIVNNKVKLTEKSNMRKDRFSSLQYNYAVMQILANELKPKTVDNEILNMLSIRQPKRMSSF